MHFCELKPPASALPVNTHTAQTGLSVLFSPYSWNNSTAHPRQAAPAGLQA